MLKKNLFTAPYTKRRLQLDVRSVFSTEEAKRFLKYLEKFCHAFEANNPTGLTSNEISYNEGLRSVYLHIRSLLTDEIVEEVENDRSYARTAHQRGTKPHPDPNRR